MPRSLPAFRWRRRDVNGNSPGSVVAAGSGGKRGLIPSPVVWCGRSIVAVTEGAPTPSYAANVQFALLSAGRASSSAAAAALCIFREEVIRCASVVSASAPLALRAWIYSDEPITCEPRRASTAPIRPPSPARRAAAEQRLCDCRTGRASFWNCADGEGLNRPST